MEILCNNRKHPIGSSCNFLIVPSISSKIVSCWKIKRFVFWRQTPKQQFVMPTEMFQEIIIWKENKRFHIPILDLNKYFPQAEPKLRYPGFCNDIEAPRLQVKWSKNHKLLWCRTIPHSNTSLLASIANHLNAILEMAPASCNDSYQHVSLCTDIWSLLLMTLCIPTRELESTASSAATGKYKNSKWTQCPRLQDDEHTVCFGKQLFFIDFWIKEIRVAKGNAGKVQSMIVRIWVSTLYVLLRFPWLFANTLFLHMLSGSYCRYNRSGFASTSCLFEMFISL